MNENLLRDALNSALALKETMDKIYESADSNDKFDKYISYKSCWQKYQLINNQIVNEFENKFFSGVYADKIKFWADLPWPEYKKFFDECYMNLNILINAIKNKLNIQIKEKDMNNMNKINTYNNSFNKSTNNEITNKTIGIGNQTATNTGKKLKIKNKQMGILGEIWHFLKGLF